MGGRPGAVAPQMILVCDAPPDLSRSRSFRKLKIKEWLFSLTDEREDPEEEAAEEETAEVGQKKKRKRKDKRTTAFREKKKKKENDKNP